MYMVRESVEDRCIGVAMTCEYLTTQCDWDVLLAMVHAPDGHNHTYLHGITPGVDGYDAGE